MGNEPNIRSRIPGALKRLQYRYVPAIKSTDYYRKLLSDLYGAVSASINNPLIKSASAFSTELRKYTKNLSDEVSTRLALLSELTIPNDLNDIFQALVFDTCANASRIHVPLTSRGDGIQARHIPIVLRYIAEEDQKSRTQGSMKVYTIWGFEEPENGLELSNTFRMADEFEEYSKEIQIFTTTHSPAFYLKKATEDSQVFYVSKNDKTENTSIEAGEDSSFIAKSMGLMPVVAPFIAELVEQLRHVQVQLDDAMKVIEKTRTKTLIVTEGASDWKHIKTAFLTLKKYDEHQELLKDLDIEFLEYEPPTSKSKNTLKLDMGCSAITTLCENYAKIPQVRKIIFIIDRDNPEALKKLGAPVEREYKEWGNNIYSFALPIPKHREQTPLICIEHLFLDDEIRTEIQCSDGTSRRLFLGYEFDAYGIAASINRFCTNRNVCGEGRINVIDGCEKERVRGIVSDVNVNFALSKMEFAERVAMGMQPYDSFSFANFIPIFEIIKAISQSEEDINQAIA